MDMQRMAQAGLLGLVVALQACTPDSALSPLAPEGARGDEVVASLGSRLNVEKTATGYITGSQVFDWALDKTADRGSLTLSAGGSQTINFTLKATRTQTSAGGVYGVAGNVCVRNDGPDATQGLRIVDIVEHWDDAAQQWRKVVETPVDVSARPVLPAFMAEAHCYPYDIKLATPPPASPVGFYRNRAQAFIDNFFAEYDPEWAQAPANFTFTPSAGSATVDARALLLDAVVCPLGFRCEPFLRIEELTGTTQTTMQVKVSHVAGSCNVNRTMLAGALLRESDTRVLRSDYTLIPVSCSTTAGS